MDYTTLKNQIGYWLDRDDLVTHVESFIELALAGLSRKLRGRPTEKRMEGVIQSGNARVQIPENVLGIRTFSANGKRLQYKPPSVVRNLGNWSGRPRFYTAYNAAIEVAPLPDGNYDCDIIFWQAFWPLDDQEQVVNGGFATDTDWNKGTGWTISGGVASATSGSASGLSQTLPQNEMKFGRMVVLSYQLPTVLDGTITPVVCGVQGTTRNASGTYLELISLEGVYPLADFDLTFNKDEDFEGTLDNVSIKFSRNWLTENATDLLFYASLMESAPFLKEDPRITVWAARYNDALLAAQAMTDWGGTLITEPAYYE